VREIRLQYQSKLTGEHDPVITSAQDALPDPEELLGSGLPCHSGGTNGALPALKGLSTGIIISHNHPSGTLTPSEAAKQLTKQLRRAAELMGINLLDHLIVTPQNTFFSFAEEGLIRF
jgi:hypothetical protein